MPSQVCLDLFCNRLLAGDVVVFGNSDEASGLPTLFDMQEYAKSLALEVRHLGYGCFSAERVRGEEVFGFLAGGAMQKIPVTRVVGDGLPPGGEFRPVAAEVGWSTVSFPVESDRAAMVAWLRAKYPMTFAELDCRKAAADAKREAAEMAAKREAEDAVPAFAATCPKPENDRWRAPKRGDPVRFDYLWSNGYICRAESPDNSRKCSCLRCARPIARREGRAVDVFMVDGYRSSTSYVCAGCWRVVSGAKCPDGRRCR